MPSKLMDHYLSTWAEMTAPDAQFEMTDTTVNGIPMMSQTAPEPGR